MNGGIAQLVEHPTDNRKILGSSPSVATTLLRKVWKMVE